MRTFLALLVGLSVTAFASQALAQAQDTAQRDAAIRKCIEEARKQFPGESQDLQESRAAVYRECMAREGQRP